VRIPEDSLREILTWVPLTCSTKDVPFRREDDRTATLTPLRGLPAAATDPDERTQGVSEPDMWFVTVTVAGPVAEEEMVRRSLERLSEERPFVVSARYCSDRAEVRYWDESDEVNVAVAQALRMWRDHMSTARLPKWRVVGLEVVDRDTARRRWDQTESPQVFVLGEIRPMNECD
jgi:hypothetical protein